MIFSEIYGVYYATMAKLLKSAAKKQLTKEEIRSIIKDNAFSESVIPFENERMWGLISNGETELKNIADRPVTALEKSWLKSVYSDPRMRLFTDQDIELNDVEPLFRPEDVSIYDRYHGGDPFEDETYIKNFRVILEAVKNKIPLRIISKDKNGKKICNDITPSFLEYSEVEDKFRVYGDGSRASMIGLAGIESVEPCDRRPAARKKDEKKRSVVFELTDQKNALERVLMHFAHFERKVEKAEDDKYIINMQYFKAEESDLVIRLLSFGPLIKVISPPTVVNNIKGRLEKQKSCGI